MKVIAQSYKASYSEEDNKFLVEVSSKEIRELMGRDWNKKVEVRIGMEFQVSVIFRQIQEVKAMERRIEQAKQAIIGALSCVEFAEPIFQDLAAPIEGGNDEPS
jgi:predicted PilT family ATPase